MGDNAQTKVPKFTAGDVLTAANTNLLANGIPVFSGTATRNDAFGGTGEKVLAEGQFAFLEDSNTTQFYDGAAWQSVGVAPGLVLVKTQTIGSAVSSVTVSSAFSATYDNYRIVVSGVAVSSTDSSMFLTLGGSAGSTYNYTGVYYVYTSTSASGLNASATATGIWLGITGGTFSVSFDLMSPFLAKATNLVGQSTGSVHANQLYGYDSNAASSTAFTLTQNTTNLTGGTVKVYGYANS